MRPFFFSRQGRFGGFGPFGDRGPNGGFDEGWREWGGFGFGGGHGRRVDRGEVKFLILSVLDEGPKHGYEIMRSIEQKSQGTYVPSAGTIYPTLQMLEDQAYIQGRETDGRKVYNLTETGRAYLAEHQQEAKNAWSRFGEGRGPGGHPGFGTDEQRQLRDELIDLARTLFAGGRVFRANPATLSRVRDILKTARQQIDSALAEYV